MSNYEVFNRIDYLKNSLRDHLPRAIDIKASMDRIGHRQGCAGVNMRGEG